MRFLNSHMKYQTLKNIELRRNEGVVMTELEKEAVWLSRSVRLYRGPNPDNDEERPVGFFQNNSNKEITKEDGKPLTDDEFVQLIKSESFKFINQEFENVVVLVGAGASITDNEFEKDDDGNAKTGVTVSKIAQEVLKQLSSNKYTLDGKKIDVFNLNDIATKSMYSLDCNNKVTT